MLETRCHNRETESAWLCPVQQSCRQPKQRETDKEISVVWKVNKSNLQYRTELFSMDKMHTQLAASVRRVFVRRRIIPIFHALWSWVVCRTTTQQLLHRDWPTLVTICTLLDYKLNLKYRLLQSHECLKESGVALSSSCSAVVYLVCWLWLLTREKQELP